MPNEIQQPKQFDIVGDPVLVGGIGQGFEATLNWRVHDGHDERTGFFNVGGGSGGAPAAPDPHPAGSSAGSSATLIQSYSRRPCAPRPIARRSQPAPPSL